MTTISAEMVLASVGRDAPPLYTMVLQYPLPIHAEFMTHRALTKNSASLRAIPTKTVVRRLRDDPFIPIHMGLNQSGMQAEQENDALVRVPRQDFIGKLFNLTKRVPVQEAWLMAMEAAITYAESIAEANYHKQVVNRILSPYLHNRVLATGTEWANFIRLRDHKDAEPHIREVAQRVKEVIRDTEPFFLDRHEWHLPYVRPMEINSDHYKEHELIGISVARSARVSYNLVDGRQTTTEEDIKLYDKLIIAQPVHASPAEHQATPDFVKRFNPKTKTITWNNPTKHRNLKGWVQNRALLPDDTAPEPWLESLVARLSHEQAA